MNESKYIQFGCGPCAPADWRNFDSSPTLVWERTPVIGKLYTKNKNRFADNVEIGDVVKGLPVKPNSAKAVYCSHVLEHLSLEECQAAIKNTFKMLEPGGTFRFVLPDLEYWIHQYVNDPSPDAAKKLLYEIQFGLEKRPKGLVRHFYEYMRTSAHLWMWDYKGLKQELEQAGFVDIRRAQFGDSPDPMFKQVEGEHRWKNCLGIDCKKPT
jgi:predicted SAM-dependent methyltransferase